LANAFLESFAPAEGLGKYNILVGTFPPTTGHKSAPGFEKALIANDFLSTE
jgi:hypothetical protein